MAGERFPTSQGEQPSFDWLNVGYAHSAGIVPEVRPSEEYNGFYVNAKGLNPLDNPDLPPGTHWET